jgi:transposase-like protein
LEIAMAKSVFDAPQFQNEAAAFEYVEARLWPHGPVCPHCDDRKATIGRLTGVRSKPSKKHPDGVEHVGLYKCYGCRKQFSVRKGTIFEDSHLPLHLWLQVIHLMCASKKGISTRQVQRMLECSMKTAWHLTHRIREAMAPGGVVGPLGGAGVTVEADETELAKSRKTKRPAGHRRIDNPKVLALVERGGNIRSVTLDHKGVMAKVRTMVHPESRLVTDKAQHYRFPPVAKHESVDHSKFEWTRGDVHTNTLEGFFSVLKRGLVGTYQRVDEKHLDRYLSEFDFRQNNRERLGISDAQRADKALLGMVGKRLTYAGTRG